MEIVETSHWRVRDSSDYNLNPSKEQSQSLTRTFSLTEYYHAFSTGLQMTMATPLSLPQILTRSVVPSLIDHLDASDVLECYSLTRSVKLAGFHNATVQKMAIGLRYDPPSNSHKRPLELTLEYGPERMGAQLQEESMPLVITGNHLSWDNEAKVYYSTASMSSYQWKSAYYMASLTGAVLEKILEKAVDYSSLRPRYQPFSVVVEELHSSQKRQVLKSSSSVDFAYQMWSDMAELGVDLRPILVPPTYVPRLHISGKVEKVSGYDNAGEYVPLLAAQFFDSVSSCWSAIATGDYSTYATGMPSPGPSMEPSQNPSAITTTPLPTTMAPTAVATPTATEVPTEAPIEVIPTSAPTEIVKDKAANTNDGQVDTLDDDEGDGKEDTTNDKADDVTDYKADEDDRRSRSLSQRLYDPSDRIPPRSLAEQEQDEEDQNDDVFLDELANHNLTIGRTDDVSLAELANHNLTIIPNDDVSLDELANYNLTINPAASSNVTQSPSAAPTGDTASEAQKAANEAHEAAAEAKNASTNESAEKAADAAEHAADAAQKAANAARWQKDMESMLSGDGTLVTQSLQQCWTDPLYGIASENTSTVVAYMYLDGNFYYRLNLTPPFMDVIELQMPIPQQHTSGVLTPDDFVDRILAFCICGLVVVSLFALLQQFGLRLAFYDRQKFFFDPTMSNPDNHDLHDAIDDSENLQRGQGREHGFAEDVIPLSMGGRRPIVRGSSQLLVTNSPTQSNRVHDLEDGDVELVGLSAIPSLNGKASPSDMASPAAQFPPPRFTRDPDLVDIYSLRSRSKVARPVTLNSLESQGDSSKDSSEHSLSGRS